MEDGPRWTEEVDDLVDAGDVDGAISLLESVVSTLSTASASTSGADLRLAAALGDLTALHASRGNTLRADDLRARAIVLRSRAAAPGPLGDHDPAEKSSSQEGATVVPKDSQVSANLDDNNEDEDDDWEAIADRGAHDDTLARSLEQQARVSSSSSSAETATTPSSSGPKRRGRGSFLYDKSVLYSDQCASERDLDDKQKSSPQTGSKGHVNEPENRAATAAAQYGTRHVLVLYDFAPSTRTTDLEKIFDKFGDHGVAIRWVNDTSALAVFRTPSAAIEAQACIPSRFKVRSLKADDLAKIDGTDLEPPKPRPKTSARTAQRLIAHGMGLKQFSNFSPDELKKQEEERRNRITARQALRDEAWGSD